jgi:hypothetical protein
LLLAKLEFTVFEENNYLQKRLPACSMVVLLNLQGKCQPLRSKPAHSSCHLPLGSWPLLGIDELIYGYLTYHDRFPLIDSLLMKGYLVHGKYCQRTRCKGKEFSEEVINKERKLSKQGEEWRVQ